MLGSTIQKELAQVLMRELHDPRLNPSGIGVPSITRVKVSPDLTAADVFVTVMGTPGQQNAALFALRQSAGIMRTRLTKALSLRVTPFLKFHIDENLKKELAVLDLIQKASEESAELDRKRAAEAAGGPAAEGEPSAEQGVPPGQGGGDADPAAGAAPTAP